MLLGVRFRRLLFVLFVTALGAGAAQAQGRGASSSSAGQRGATVMLDGDRSAKGAPHRTIVGHVTGIDGKADKGALVYLKEVNTSTIRTMSVDENGDYQFGPLPLTVDYQLWAEDGDHKTAIKPISSYIETNYLSIPLRFEAAAPAASASK